MNVWILLFVGLGAVCAAPVDKKPVVVVDKKPVVVVVKRPPPPPPPPPPGTESKAKAAGRLKTVGNAKGHVGGGSIVYERRKDQQSDANARTGISSQLEGIGEASAASKGTSGVVCVDGYEVAQSTGDAASSGASAGQATTEADANGRAATICKNTKTDGESGASSATRGDGKTKALGRSIGQATSTDDGSTSNSGSELIAKSLGGAGSRVTSRGRAAGLGKKGDTITISGSQNEGDVIGKAAVRARQIGGAAAGTDEGPYGKSAETVAGSKGEVQTAGKGSNGGGETNAQARAGDDTTNSKSKTGQKLEASRGGAAAAETKTAATSSLQLDKFGDGLFTRTDSTSSGRQQSLGSGSSDANAASTGANKLGGSGSLSDTTYKAKTAGDGGASGAQQARGEGFVSLKDRLKELEKKKG